MLLIKAVNLIDAESKTVRACDILVDNGVIAEIGEIEPRGGARVISADGLFASAGLIDIHVHFREPGFEYKEDISTGAKAAAKGGFTTVVCMANTKPALDNPDTLGYVLDAGRKSDINVLTVAAVSKGLAGEELTDMAKLKRLGAVGFSDDGVAICDEEFLTNAMLAAKELDAPISLHEEYPEMIHCAGVNDGAVAEAMGIRGAPPESESCMVGRDCELALKTGARLHFQHLSTKESVSLVREYKKRGASITAEVTPQHLTLTEEAVREKGTLAKLNPPFRTEEDRQSLIAGIKDGTIDIIATDHAPHSAEEKSRPLTEAPSGIIGLETALSLVITKLVRTGIMTLPEVIEKMTVNPAKLYKLDAGCIKTGKRADIVLFDPNESFTVGGFESKSSNSPFIGETLYGKVKYTICGGRIVYQDCQARDSD